MSDFFGSILSFLGFRPKTDPPSRFRVPSIDSLNGAVDELIKTQDVMPTATVRRSAEEVLEYLHNKCTDIEKRSKGYPHAPIQGDVWMDGAALGPIAEKVAHFLKSRELFELERIAHAIRCRAILSVQSHYHHIVGPAMLEHCDCNERLGNNEAAIRLYESVIADFAWIVDEYEADVDAPIEDRESLDCLMQAIERRQKLKPEVPDKFNDLRDRCRIVLNRKG